MKKITLLFVMAMGIFASCVPYPEENPDPVTPVNKMFLLKLVETLPDETTSEMVFTYADKKIVEINDSDGTKTVFSYQDDLITKRQEFSGTTLLNQDDYVYDISENLISLVNQDFTTSVGTRWVYVHNANGTISYQQFTGDLLTQNQLELNGLISSNKLEESITDPVTNEVNVYRTTYAFDLKNNPLMNVVGYNKIYFANTDSALNYVNNVISQTDQTNDETPVLRYTNEYEYTPNNFPYKRNTKQGGVLVATANYFY